MRHIIITITLLSLLGCSAALVPYTSDPKQKLSDAIWLFDEKQRALPAEKLLLETIDIYKKNSDEAGLAEVYKAYGIFLRSYAVDRYSDHYKEKGFKNSEVTIENRYQKSIEYLEKSRSIYENQKKYDYLANIYLHMAFSYLVNEKVSEGCDMFNKSLEKNKIFMDENPGAQVKLAGFKSYVGYIDNLKQKAKCSAQ